MRLNITTPTTNAAATEPSAAMVPSSPTVPSHSSGRALLVFLVLYFHVILLCPTPPERDTRKALFSPLAARAEQQLSLLHYCCIVPVSSATFATAAAIVDVAVVRAAVASRFTTMFLIFKSNVSLGDFIHFEITRLELAIIRRRNANKPQI